VRPVAGRVSSPFGERIDPLHGQRALHRGVDIAAPAGSPVAAAAGGVVVRAGERGGYGLAVEVEHDDGTTSLYAHAGKLLVAAGDRVDRGQPIALVGHTGRATGDHLHFELRRAGRPVDPAAALKVYRTRAESSE
jgi:murein DD-endopeptidase MepM/ murein hydrolase activator NlpD